ncbi:glycoside hydrolase family 3 protein [Zasmidium cellare ATCC 36951]|uniref:xylan 1,4-beta-xylosidase n=1 Tax=Zasmidium cellare ATCC 36951 TaxID=1080233 RepID=A0A6A6D3N7_ZASCE|nr:glycoside hydrolase family 3 protein [Zasmidium cellare ATCC 36951]KAF2172749.1 glycoside hydrolase family 3 protein [Zasmidium cellare ATCC 36951]
MPPFAVPLQSILPVVSGRVRELPNCEVEPLSQNGICNMSLPIHERAFALVDAMTAGEKFNATSSYQPNIDRLGLPPLWLWNEGLHGVASSVGVIFEPNGSYSYATSFPQPILMAAAFDDDLIHEVAETISTEMRAFSNGGHAGLGVFTPNINPFKDPRWGRGKETPGEDPFRVSSYTRALLSGLETSDVSEVKKMVATCKHYGAYDLEYWHDTNRFIFDAKVTTQDLANYYMPSFEACARDMQAGSVMCSYNAVNGIPSCVDEWLLTALLKMHWGWNASDHFVTGDCFTLDAVFKGHNFTDTAEETAAAAIKAGTDNDCGAFYPTFLPNATSQGLVDMESIDRAIARAYGAMIKVGYFDPPSQDPYRSINWTGVNTNKAQGLARRAASAGMTLLKNVNHTLPLRGKDSDEKLSLALVGDWANATKQMQGGYSGVAPFLHSPYDGLLQVEGVDVQLVTDINNTAPALKAAQSSDVIIYVGGMDELVEAEGLDRTSIAWNTTQTALINALADLEKPFVLVQTGGGQLDDSAFLSNPSVGAILWAGYPGQDGGNAIADILFGKVAPAGRLPVTQYPASYTEDIPMTDMALRAHANSPGRTYKWYTGEAVLPYGYGLHYTNFSVKAWSKGLTGLTVNQVVDSCGCSDITHIDTCIIGYIQVAVSNTGDVCSDYSALSFVSGEFGPAPRPIKQLIAYKRLKDIEPGTVEIASMPLTLGALSRWDEGGRRIFYPGTYRIAIDTTPDKANFTFEITGEERVLETWPEQRQ